MRSDIKLGIYVAAGVGVFAILKRYGVLQDVGRWLSDQVPEDVKRQAAHTTKQVRDRLGEAGEYVRGHAEKIGEDVKQRAGHVASAANGASSTIAGKIEETVGADGSTAKHHVGRGVTH